MEDYSMDSSAVEDAIAIANAYREASEADTVDVLRTQSQSGQSEGSTVSIPGGQGSSSLLKYYLVGADWFRKAWDNVLKLPECIPENWLELVGNIDNSPLVVAEVPGQYTQSAGAPTIGVKKEGNVVLRKGLQHEKDFVLVGSHAWLLLSNKFGFTHVCLATVRVHKTAESNLAVDPYRNSPSLSNGNNMLIPIPATGRFPYEQTLGFSTSIVEETMKNPQDDEDECKFPAKSETVALPLDHVLHATFDARQQVSDDSDNEQDISPNMDISSDTVADEFGPSQPQGRVLLLPPSTAMANSNNELYSPIGKSRNDRGSNTIDDDFTNNPASNDDYWAMDDNMGSVSTLRTVTTLSRFRYGSGLGNLGNTCFMNSTLQCLGHTQPLQRYFLTGDFRRDLNRDNPLGTGGELATAFADLITEMWSQETTTALTKSNSILEQDSGIVKWSPNTAHVVYPREFKSIVGKHAEQFVGYEQHDSQEFATYLLDALHEDTSRISKKPYIEKPEQEEGESDQEAADKAWGLHLQRENSYVSENFMGQVKSRVQCCEPGCGRVSTTFDPFMYLSVPIPGSSERTINVYYVSTDPMKRVQNFSVTVPKIGTIQEVVKRTRDQVLKLGIESELLVEDMAVVDVWQKEIYAWYEHTDEIDRIKENDDTYVFALRPKADVMASSKRKNEDDDGDLRMYNIRESQPKRYQLDLATMTELNSADNWTNEFAKYLRNHLGFLNAFNPTKGTTDDRVKIFQRTSTFLEQCYNDTKDLDLDVNAKQVNEELIKELVSRSDASPVFENVKSMHDLAILEFCAAKMRTEILRMIKAKKNESPGGIKICIRMKSPGVVTGARSQYFCSPMVLRVSPDLTVYGLREELARRLSRCLRLPGDKRGTSGQATSESEADNTTDGGRGSEMARLRSTNGGFGDSTFGSPELLIMRQIPLSYDKKNPGYAVKSYENSCQLGSLEKQRNYRSSESGRQAPMASQKDSEENQIVSHLVGDQGTVNLEWTNEMVDELFDTGEYEAVNDPTVVAVEGNAPVTRAKKAAKGATSVLDCIEKYCQMEQLEESEMWYCNRCKQHVRAWKQFFLYRTPPILIIHLKRFQYSAKTHRRDKINAFINFPLEGLDLSDHVMHWTEDQKPIYDCYAVSNHFGGLGGGHYTAHALNDDGVWCYYDDSRITTDVDKSSIISDAAYVLYFRRRDVPIDEDFLVKLPTPEPVGPAIIADVPDTKIASTSSEVSGSNAAVVDDDNMEVEDTCSHSTSVGSMEGMDEFVPHSYQDDRLPDEEQNRLARQ